MKLQGVVSVAVLSLLLATIAISIPKSKKDSSSEPPEAISIPTEVFGVKIEKNPPQSRLDELAVATWPTWEGGLSKIPWTFTKTETMYLLKGKVKVKVNVDGQEEWFEIGGGDLVVFPKGMKITWDVIEAVKKHYHLETDEASSST